MVARLRAEHEAAPLRVLLVEVSTSEATSVVSELQRSGRRIAYERVSTTAAMRAALERKPWDVVISDWSTTPASSGRAALDLLKELGLDLPFIVVSGTLSEEHAVAAMRAGAHDYVPKDKLERLTPAVERELVEHEARRRLQQADLARHESERRMRRMVESAMVGIWFFAAEGRTSFMNPRMAQILGLSADEAAHASVADFLHHEDRPAFEARLAQRAAAVPSSYEQAFRRADGSAGWGLVESNPVHDENGVFEGVLHVMTDITERRQSEAARREAELRFHCIFDSRITGVIIANAAGTLLEANDTFLDMVGYTREDLRARSLNWREVTPPQWQNRQASATEELHLRGSIRPFEKEYLRKDGTRVPVLMGLALLDESRVLSVVTDLTERKLAETALDERVRVNLALEEQLRQSQKMEAVGRLAGGIAHDFNNLLSIVLGYSELLMADLKDGDPLRDDVAEIHRAGVRAADLTGRLLTFSRQQVVEPKVLDLNDVISGMDTMLRRLVGEDVDLTCVPGSSLGRVRADRGSIEQVIMNLAINARDAMPTGGQLTMETANAVLDEGYTSSHLGAAPGSYVRLSITDTGAGMDKATQSRIFEPFFTTKEKGKGTGLGLSTVFGIVQQSGGNIWVYSEPGLGTTFKVYLPRVDAMVEESKPQKTLKSAHGSETILLVEDEEQVRNVARGILRRHGYTVIEAGNAGEALLLCEKHAGPIHLLLTDVVMPHMSGPELAKRLAQSRPEMKVLCMSGYTDDTAVRHGVLDASFAYLQKPITVETLTRRVREVLDASRDEVRQA